MLKILKKSNFVFLIIITQILYYLLIQTIILLTIFLKTVAIFLFLQFYSMILINNLWKKTFLHKQNQFQIVIFTSFSYLYLEKYNHIAAEKDITLPTIDELDINESIIESLDDNSILQQTLSLNLDLSIHDNENIGNSLNNSIYEKIDNFETFTNITPPLINTNIEQIIPTFLHTKRKLIVDKTTTLSFPIKVLYFQKINKI